MVLSRSIRDYSDNLNVVTLFSVLLILSLLSLFLPGTFLSSGSSAAVQMVCEKYFTVRNRITWEREKGRGALHNWKNCSEDIWFCTVSEDSTFNVDAVKLKRKVLAPYTNQDGKPKDWERSDNGNYRLTHPSNLWTDISVPFMKKSFLTLGYRSL